MVTKPTVGSSGWGPTLNAALDDMDVTVPGSAAATALSSTFQTIALAETKAHAASTYTAKRNASRALTTPHRIAFSGGTYAHNAFPGAAVAANGNVLFAYRGGPNHGPSKGVIVMRASTDNMLSLGAEYQPVTDATFDLRDPRLTRLADNRIALSYFIADAATAAGQPDGCRVAFSSDNGATFGTPVAVDSPFTGTASCSAPVVQLADGTLLLPIYGKNTGDTYTSAVLMQSTNGGTTWLQRSVIANGQVDGKNYQEPNVALAASGELVALVRVEPDGNIQRAVSTDSGVVFGALSVAFAGSGAPGMLFVNDVLHVLYRSTGTGRPMMTRESKDLGLAWTAEVRVDTVTTWTSGTYGVMLPLGKESIRYFYGVESSFGGAQSDIYLVDGLADPDRATYASLLPTTTGVTDGSTLVRDSTKRGGTRWGSVGTAKGVRGVNTAHFSVPSGTATPVTFSAEDYDTDAIHILTSSQFIVPSGMSGLWMISGTIYYAAHTTGVRQARIHKNEILVVGGLASIPTTGGAEASPSVTVTLRLVGGDIIQLNAFQDSGVALNARFENTSLSMVYLGSIV